MTEQEIRTMVRNEDRLAWAEFLKTATMQEAVYAHIVAHKAGLRDMAVLAHKREQHLDGEIRHPDLWT